MSKKALCPPSLFWSCIVGRIGVLAGLILVPGPHVWHPWPYSNDNFCFWLSLNLLKFIILHSNACFCCGAVWKWDSNCLWEAAAVNSSSYYAAMHAYKEWWGRPKWSVPSWLHMCPIITEKCLQQYCVTPVVWQQVLPASQAHSGTFKVTHTSCERLVSQNVLVRVCVCIAQTKMTVGFTFAGMCFPTCVCLLVCVCTLCLLLKLCISACFSSLRLCELGIPVMIALQLRLHYNDASV